MARYVVLDSGPFGLATHRPGHPDGDACRAWVNSLRVAGARIVIPEIADYEVRRELLRASAHTGLTRLDVLEAAVIYDAITTTVIRKAAEFWAYLRRMGRPTASDLALDGDAILAAQAALIGGHGDTVTIATSNVAHLARFPGIHAQEWANIS